MIFAKEELRGFSQPKRFEDLTVEFQYPLDSTGYILVGSTSELFTYGQEGPGKLRLEPKGVLVELGQTGFSIRLEELIPRATPVVKRSDDPGAKPKPAIELAVHGGQSHSRTRFLVGDREEPVFLGDREVVLVYRKQFKEPKDYKSVLRIIENEKVVRTKTIEVNSPLGYRGYKFYQSTYDPDDLTKTGLQVVKDPGLPIVYAGFFLLLGGILITFYIKPRFLVKGGEPSGQENEEKEP